MWILGKFIDSVDIRNATKWYQMISIFFGFPFCKNVCFPHQATASSPGANIGATTDFKWIFTVLWCFMGMSKDWAPKNVMVSIFVVQVAGTCGTYTMNCDPNPSHLNSKIPMSILEDGSVCKTMHDIWARTLGCGSICSCSNWWNLTNFAACVVYTDFKGQPKKNKPVLILMFFFWQTIFKKWVWNRCHIWGICMESEAFNHFVHQDC